MSEVSQPIWLKIMEHGAAGEARTKAFLLDRFWVLERSVDIDGADFLIQLRSLNNRFTDSAPPRVGIVQAKYYQDKSTTQHIPCRYVVDDKGKPLNGFFAILNVGREDDSEMYLLSSADIVETLSRSSSEPANFVVGAKAFKDKFRVINRSQALDKIQHAISGRSSIESLRFLDQVNIPYRKVEKEAIDYDYTLPIPNSQADIAKTFYEYRNNLRSLLYDMEEVLVAIDNIFKTTDPRMALIELGKIHEFRVNPYNTLSDGVMFSGFKLNLDWNYLPEALEEHEKILAALEKLNKRAAFINLSARVRKQLCDKVDQLHDEAKLGEYYVARLKISISTLTMKSLNLTSTSARPQRTGQEIIAYQSIGGSIDNKKRSASELSENLWHSLLTDVLALLGISTDEDDQD
ncbi:hypothetical protein Q095_00356 [Pseudomonas aeruginosa PS50]|uniref:hypothetical protein n=1 Tax=Pseudomonas aeruginosa TaxID=287 RepID=UPI000445B40D|nr:hypothetical protein [Pseudomonas aeruginosa]ETU79903.1 hypothetical protein Q095_00356 [Pseudomonas aeruginosa PS50]